MFKLSLVGAESNKIILYLKERTSVDVDKNNQHQNQHSGPFGRIKPFRRGLSGIITRSGWKKF
jgi:hypothetical protein